MPFNFSNFSVAGDSISSSSFGSAGSTGASTASSSAPVSSSGIAGFQIGQALVNMVHTYQMGSIQAKNIKAMQEINNKRVAVRFGLERWQQNEQAAEQRAALSDQKLDAQTLHLQQEAALEVQQAFLGQSGGSAERVALQTDIEAQRVQDDLEDKGFTLNREIAINEAAAQLKYRGQLQIAEPERPSLGLSVSAGITDVVKIGQNYLSGG